MSSTISEVLQNKQLLTTGFNKLKTTVISKPYVNCKGYKCTTAQVDWLVDQAIDARVATVSLNGRSMRPWYCKMAYVLGSEVFLRCISQAREGRDKAKLFSYLLKRALESATPQPKVTNTRG